MYIPSPFRVEDEETLYRFIERHSFGLLVSVNGGVPSATHLPLLLDRRTGELYGHMARANPQWRELADQEPLAVFQGPHHYISSSWYETPVSVPTWNYAAVHVYGTFRLVEQEGEMLEILHHTVAKYEEPESPYRIDKSNRELVEGLLKGIVAFRIKIDRMEGKWKLSQNHSLVRRNRVIERLETLPGDHARDMARLMREFGEEFGGA